MNTMDPNSVSRVMRTSVKTIQENDIPQKACKVMIENNTGSVIVIAAAHSINAQSPIGTITGTDIVSHMTEEKPSLIQRL